MGCAGIAAHEDKDKEASTVLTNCKLRLVKLFGNRWNAAWKATGFPGQSTAIPNTMDLRFNLLNSLATYFTATPASESVEANATAALCEAKHAELSTARQEMNSAKSTLATRKKDAEKVVSTLRKRVRGLIEELGTLLADDDERYEAFGLNIPANPTAPEPIASLTVTVGGGGKLHLQWPHSKRMTGTRLQKKVIGVDDNFVSVGTADGLEKTLTDFTAGQNIVFRAIAYNDGGDASPSPEVSVTVT